MPDVPLELMHRVAERAPGRPQPVGPAPSLAQALRDPACYPHPVGAVDLRETHISWVFLAGDFAYKVKKAVKLPFLDFSTLEARRGYCLEEVRLNARTAPQLYLGVVPITAGPRIDGVGEPIEFAVRMRRFPAGALFDEHARAGTLTRGHVEALARRLAAFHAAAERRGEDSAAHAREAQRGALDNFCEMKVLTPPAAARLAGLGDWTAREAASLAGRFDERARAGFVRDCHGDLHLANVALVDGEPMIFDCIEFSPRFRVTDVAADVAFASMDLEHRGLPGHRARFIDCYLEASGDYAMLRVLRFYEVYRAMVRAKIALLRRAVARPGTPAGQAAGEDFESYVRTAEHLARRPRPALVLMHGPSGSGKTAVSGELLEAAGAVRLRSDVERKRLHGLSPLESARAAPGAGIYGEAAALATYDRLAMLAGRAMAAGYPVIVDATFLRRRDRERFRALALECGAGFEILSCTAPAALLRERVAQRRGDASDAGIAVLEEQLRCMEPLDREESARATVIDTSDARAREAAIRSLPRWLRENG